MNDQTSVRKPLDLDAILARVAAATDGPWRWHDRSDPYCDATELISESVHDMEDDGEGGSRIYYPAPILTEPTLRTTLGAHRDPDAQFIAHAREDMPALVAELRECRTQRDENLANVRRLDDLRIAETARLQRELDAARAADARLTALAERSYFGSRPGSKERALAEAVVRILNEAAGTDQATAGEGV